MPAQHTMTKTKAEKETPKTLSRKVTKALPCKLSEEEVLKYGRDLGRAYADKSRVETELDGIKAEYKGRVKEQDALIEKLSARVHSGIETRDVACMEVKNWTEGTVEVRRLDTNEIVESRPMREDEKQMEIATGITEGGKQLCSRQQAG